MASARSPWANMILFFGTVRLSLPRPIVARKVAGLNSRFFGDAAAALIASDFNPALNHTEVDFESPDHPRTTSRARSNTKEEQCKETPIKISFLILRVLRA